MSSAATETETKVVPQTSFYVVAESVCPACEGRCRDNKQSRWGEPDFCAHCGGHGVTGSRVDLREALVSLGVALPTAPTTNNSTHEEANYVST